MIASNKLKGRIVEMGLTQAQLAKQLGIAPCTMAQKINNVRGMSLDEADKLCEILKIPIKDFAAYFFAKDVA